MMGLGRITVPCPRCNTSLQLVVTGQDLGAENGVFTVGVSVDREQLDAEVAAHVAERHAG